ncbi:hypothetical protein [Hymenobacter sp. IS2118]|uniref:hypothetical protein n=1 Tax=Hymenobacter sp. IS2118 TaxID=1505605 RepID=UPI0005517FDB|nr:hypothetical protein [Hymenobacter sp. IS2118]
MSYSNGQIIILLAIVPTIIAALIAALKWRALPAGLRPLAMLVFFALFTEAFSRVLWVFKLSNLFMWPVYIGVEFGLLVWMYSRVIDSHWLRRSRWVLTVAMAGLAVAEGVLRASQTFRVDNAVRLLESLSVILLVLAYYHVSLRRPSTAYIWQEPLFWVSTGLLFYFAGNFLIYTFVNFAYFYHRHLTIQLWVVHAALNSLLYCTYAYALWISPKS